jgi:hypothetical protein
MLRQPVALSPHSKKIFFNFLREFPTAVAQPPEKSLRPRNIPVNREGRIMTSNRGQRPDDRSRQHQIFCFDIRISSLIRISDFGFCPRLSGCGHDTPHPWLKNPPAQQKSRPNRPFTGIGQQPTTTRNISIAISQFPRCANSHRQRTITPQQIEAKIPSADPKNPVSPVKSAPFLRISTANCQLFHTIPLAILALDVDNTP